MQRKLSCLLNFTTRTCIRRHNHRGGVLLATFGMLATTLLSTPSQAQYLQRNIVSDITGLAELQDANLKNPWGASHSASSPFWVSNARSNTATLYNVNGTTGAVSINPLVVNTPGPISGQIANSSDFNLGSGGSARFLFAGLDGNIYGWNGAQGTHAATAHTGEGHLYTGISSGKVGNDNFLYVANLSEGKVEAFNNGFNEVSLTGNFTDPNLPAGYSPFNVKNIGGQLYVTYLHQGGPGGIVNVFNTDGTFAHRFATDGTLLNPWGVVQAPGDFGKFSNALLVGNFNFGDDANGAGYINAFDPTTGAFLGLLEDPNGQPVEIDGLWEILFGNGANGGIRNQLYFTAGIEGEQHGLFGSLQSVPEPGTWALLSAMGVLGMGLNFRRKSRMPHGKR